MESTEGRWLFSIKTDDRPGAAASIALAFAGRGLQIESFIGYGDVNYHRKDTEGVIAITFKAFERHMKHVANVLKRLEQVREIATYDYHDPGLVKTATIRITQTVDELKAIAADNAVKITDLQHEKNDSCGAVISGRPAEVDAVIEKAMDQGILVSSIYAILPPK